MSSIGNWQRGPLQRLAGGDITRAAPDTWSAGYTPSPLERLMYPDRTSLAPLRGLPQSPGDGLTLLSDQTQGSWQTQPFGPSITAKDGVPLPGPNIHALLACIAGGAGAPFRVTSTTNDHPAGDPHTQDQAVDGTAAPMDRAALMQAAANCGAVYQQDEYAHPSKGSTGGHLHFQTRPGRGGATGPYFAIPVPGKPHFEVDSGGLKGVPGMKFAVFSAIFCLLASEGNAASSLSTAQAATLTDWLNRNPQFQSGTEADCECNEDIKQMREVGPWGKPIPDFEPYMLAGDFRGNGQSDFAVIVRKNSTDDGTGTIVIFDGPFDRTAVKRPAYIGRLNAIKHMALFQSQEKGWPIFGLFESEGCLVRPRGRTYVMDCRGF